MLRFEKAKDFFNGNQRIELIHSDLDLSELHNYPELGIFDVRTFLVFQKKQTTDMAYGPVNEIFNMLSIEEQTLVAKTILLMSAKIREDDESYGIDPVTEVVRYCGTLLKRLNDEIKLCRLLETYVRDFVNIADMSDAGSHPNDREDLTFVQEEAILITAISILCKMFSPIIGSFIYKYSGYISSKDKESIIGTIYTELFESEYKDLINKLNHYINRLVYNKVKDDISSHQRGLTPAIMARNIFAILTTKKFVIIDLHRHDGNIIKYIASFAKSYIDSQIKNGQTTAMIKPFDNPKESDVVTVVEDSNNSRVETESRPSKKPADVVPIANVSAAWAVENEIKINNIDKEFITNIFNWYMDNYKQMTPISTLIISNYFGPVIGGGTSVYLLNEINAIKLASILQLVSMQNKYENIAHALTMYCSIEDRVSDTEDFRFQNSWRSSVEYIDCKRTITNAFGMTSWDTKLRDMATMLTQKNYIYHTAPDIWKIGGYKVNNDRIFNNYSELMREVLIMMRTLWEQRSMMQDVLNTI